MGIVIGPGSSLGKNSASEWPKSIWKEYPQEHGPLSEVHTAIMSWENTGS